ncbi:MAG TPA: hypothetical protein VJH97_02020 [Candidatus Nanoarchaeia archaeon]|nr:hypothetical protein [Candidatus Nanoarchaeia archaeon]
MKISIDTKEDTHEDIRKVIRMLQHLVGEGVVTNAPRNIFEDPDSFGASSDSSAANPSESGVFGNMFESGATVPEIRPKEKIPEIIPY